jgi:hypothetical protein
MGSYGKKGTEQNSTVPSILYVDDTDLFVDKVYDAIQDSMNSGGNLMIATGGMLQPSKCFYSIILIKWKNGIWTYANNSLKGEFGITVPLPGGSEAAIDHKRVDHTEKTLGSMTSPDRNSSTIAYK